MTEIVYVNGEFLPITEAKISVMDRGFLFGDAVYEVIPIYQGRLFRLDQHLARLEKSLDAIRMTVPLSRLGWREIIKELLRKNPDIQNATVYLHVSRGPQDSRDHAIPAQITPTIFLKVTAYTPPTYETLAKGIHAITAEDIRWEYCYIKSVNLLANILLLQNALDSQAQECILIRDGHALEGSTSNLFMVKNNQVFTPPIQAAMLGGITRDLILEILQKLQIPYLEQDIPLKDLLSAEEIWMTSSGKEIRPVITLNQKNVGYGKPGAIWGKVVEAYQEVKRTDV